MTALYYPQLIALCFQSDIVAVNEEVLKLGLLFAADMDVSLEEQPEYYSFHHKLIQEHMAARYLITKVKQDRENFSHVFPHWRKIEYSYREVVKFMLGMDESIGEQVCGAYADHLVEDRSYLLPVYLLRYRVLLNNSIKIYDGSKCNKISNLTVREALLSSLYVVAFENVKDQQILHHSSGTGIHYTCQHRTKAILMIDCCLEVVQLILGFIQGIPITHLRIVNTEVKNASDTSYNNPGIQPINEDQKENLVTLCRRARGIYLRSSVLPLSLITQLGNQLHGCLQLHTLCLELVKTLLPDGSKTYVLPDELVTAIETLQSLTHFKLYGVILSPAQCETLCRGLKYLNKLQVLRIGWINLGKHGQYFIMAINTWQPMPRLKELSLYGCKLPSELTGGLLQAIVNRCQHLEELDMSYNDLGGQVPVLTLPLLKYLIFKGCKLQPSDGHAIGQHRLSQLEYLWLSENPSLGEEGAATIISGALTHHQRNLRINLMFCNLPEQFVQEWEQKCKGTCVEARFNW